MKRRERQWTLADPSYFNTSTVHTTQYKEGGGGQETLKPKVVLENTNREEVGWKEKNRESGR